MTNLSGEFVTLLQVRKAAEAATLDRLLKGDLNEDLWKTPVSVDVSLKPPGAVPTPQ
jgi:hypothetical protein